MLKMVDGTGIIGVDMVCPLGGTVSPPQPPNYDKVEMEGVGSLTLPNSLKAPLERLELIGNSMQGENPAPEAPQEIKSAGRKLKNLFNKNAVKQGYEFGSMATDTETVKQGWFVSDFMPVKAITYCISGKATGNGCKLYNKDKVFVKNMQVPFGNIKFDDGIAYFRINGEIKDLDKIQVEEGNVATDYEPYGYLLDLKVTGKNLLDKSIILPLSSYDIKDGIYWRKYFYLLPNTDYLIRVTPHYTEKLVDTSGFLGVGEPYDNNLPNGIISLIPDVGTTDKTNYFRTDATGKLILKFKDSANEENIRKMLEQVEITLALKTFNNEHEPYHEQTVQIALDEPLRGIGDYKDIITKDGVVRKIYPPYEINLNDLRDGGYSKTNTVMFSVKVQNKTVGYASSKPSILCNILPDCALQMSNIYNNDKECIAVGGGIVLFRVNKSRLKDMSSFEATKQSFIELMADKKMIVEYALETPVTEPLPESVQQQLQALHSENGTTHVLVDSGEVPCGNKLTYRKEK